MVNRFLQEITLIHPAVPKFYYVGSSWAKQSFGAGDSPVTNLAQEWDLPFTDLSECAVSCMNRVDLAKRTRVNDAMIWLYPEPLIDLEIITGLSRLEFMQRDDWIDIRNECDYRCMKEINDLGVPVFMIGAHSDVVDYGFENIEIGCHSWQKWLAQAAGLSIKDGSVFVNTDGIGNNRVDHCWGGEIIHQAIHRYPDINPDPELLDKVIDIFLFWKELEKHELFYEVHPSHNGNVLFAKEIKAAIIKFLQDQS